MAPNPKIHTPNPPTPDSFDAALHKYTTAYETRLHALRKWVNLKHAEHRIDFGVKRELNAYFGKRKFGDRPSAKHLSKYACQALELSEHDLGTDLAWVRARTWIFGERWGEVFGKMIEGRMGGEGYGVCGPGYVGEEDVESWAGGTEYWEGEGRDGLVEDGYVEQRRSAAIGEPWPEGEQADVLDDDEANGLKFLDSIGNIPPDDDGNPELQEPPDVAFDPGKGKVR